LPWHFGMRNSRCGETFIWFSPGKIDHKQPFRLSRGFRKKKNQNVPALWLLNYGNVAEIGATKMMFQN